MAERDDGVDAPRPVDEAREDAEEHEENKDEGVGEGEADDDDGHSEKWARRIIKEINTKRKSNSTEPALTDGLRTQLLEDVKNAQTYKATKVQDSPAVVTGIRMVKSTKQADYWPWLVWDGEFPNLARTLSPHTDAAGIVAARKTDFWLAYVLARTLYGKAGQCDLPLQVVEPEGLDLLIAYRNFMKFLSGEPAQKTLLTSLGFSIIQFHENKKRSLISRGHSVAPSWPEPARTLKEFMAGKDIKRVEDYRSDFKSRHMAGKDDAQQAQEIFDQLAACAKKENAARDGAAARKRKLEAMNADEVPAA
jgi:hypothetical protein